MLRRVVVVLVFAGVRVSTGFVVPLFHQSKDAMTLRSTSAEKTDEKAIGVDIWGDPVTESDMKVAPQAEMEPVKKEEPRLYTAEDFSDSEWKLGVLWRGKKEIEVSWFRCKADRKAEWGFERGNVGRWMVDDGKFFTITRDYVLGWNGKKLFTGQIGEDPNYLEGIIRGWKPWEPASIMGRWQAVRLNVERPNPPPWHDLEIRLEKELDRLEKIKEQQLLKQQQQQQQQEEEEEEEEEGGGA